VKQKNKSVRTHMCFVEVLFRYVRFPSVWEIDIVVYWNITYCNFIGDCQRFGGNVLFLSSEKKSLNVEVEESSSFLDVMLQKITQSQVWWNGYIFFDLAWNWPQQTSYIVRSEDLPHNSVNEDVVPCQLVNGYCWLKEQSDWICWF
jgi:hypothetical protein